MGNKFDGSFQNGYNDGEGFDSVTDMCDYTIAAGSKEGLRVVQLFLALGIHRLPSAEEAEKKEASALELLTRQIPSDMNMKMANVGEILPADGLFEGAEGIMYAGNINMMWSRLRDIARAYDYRPEDIAWEFAVAKRDFLGMPLLLPLTAEAFMMLCDTQD